MCSILSLILKRAELTLMSSLRRHNRLALPHIPLLASNHPAVHHLLIPYSAHKLANSVDLRNPSKIRLRV
jgi:predicted alpha/beta-fold hydrolase